MGPRAGLGLLFLAAGAVGCGGGDDSGDDFRYDRADVEAALFGTWQGTWEPSDGRDPSALELELSAPDQGGLGSMCGNRTLGGLRPQCAATSSMAVSGTVTLADAAEPVELDGGLTVPSLILSEVWVSLSRDGAPFDVTAQWTESTGWSLCRAEDGAGNVVASCTLTERAP